MSDLNKLIQSNIEFGVDLYKKLSACDSNSNIFFSPMSISLALAMTSLGARGNSEIEMKKVLKFNEIENVHQMFKMFINQLMQTNNKFTLHVANRLFVAASNLFLENFVTNCNDYYGSDLESLDFKNHAKDSESIINKWVEDKTNGKIKNIIPSGTLNALTQLVLVNSIYFKGAWASPFCEDFTREDDFFIAKNKTVKVPMMHFFETNLRYYFHEDFLSQILELPYLDNVLSFVIILPDLTKTNMHEVEKLLSCSPLQNISDKLTSREVNVWLPKFKLESEPDLMVSLQELGMIGVFLQGTADLSGINGSKNLFISSLLHKAFIEVNELGSEAAAASVVGIELEYAIFNKPKPVDFRADHPFIFLIKDNRSGAILFLGKFCRP